MPRPLRPLTASTVRLLALSCVVALGACDAAAPAAGPLDLADAWIESSPGAVGLDAGAVAEAEDRIRAIPRAQSLLVVKGGRLVVDGAYRRTTERTLHDVRSVTKSVVGLLTGIAIDRGHLALDTPIAEVLDHPGLRPEHDAITVEHLLTMTGGFEWDEFDDDDYQRWIGASDLVGFLLARPVVETPGTTFAYNSAAVHLLSRVLAGAVGEPLHTFAATALFEPLGIESWAWGSVRGAA